VGSLWDVHYLLLLYNIIYSGSSLMTYENTHICYAHEGNKYTEENHAFYAVGYVMITQLSFSEIVWYFYKPQL
jgi:hypothetical protein